MQSHRGNLGIFVWSIAEGGAIHRVGINKDITVTYAVLYRMVD